MGTNLAADAATVELLGDGDIVELLDENIAPNPLAVRDALLELADLNAKADEVASLKKQIVERYDEKVKAYAGRAQAIRDSLTAYCKRFGKVSFPDVGGVHLTTQNKGGKLIVTDSVAFESWVESNFHPDVAHGCYELVFRPALALDKLVEDGIKATADGKVVHAASGEVQEIDGVSAVAESKCLAVRKP